MGYDSSKLNLAGQAVKGARLWDYEDTGGETSGTFQGAGWFTDAKNKGVDTGDRIVIRDQTNNKQYTGRFSTVQDTGATTGTVSLDT